MKNRFAEYYKPTEAEVQDLWNTATIVFDTNVLLDLYRYDATTRDEVIQIITFYKERLWIPYQVGWEFHRNRKVVIKQNASRSTSQCIEQSIVRFAIGECCRWGG